MEIPLRELREHILPPGAMCRQSDVHANQCPHAHCKYYVYFFLILPRPVSLILVRVQLIRVLKLNTYANLILLSSILASQFMIKREG